MRQTFDFLLSPALGIPEDLTPLCILDTQTKSSEISDRPRLPITPHRPIGEADRISPLNLEIPTPLIPAFRILGRPISRVFMDGQVPLVPPTTMRVRSGRVEHDRSDRGVRGVGGDRVEPVQVGVFEVGFSVM